MLNSLNSSVHAAAFIQTFLNAELHPADTNIYSVFSAFTDKPKYTAQISNLKH
jgi:hypothetical protein